MTKTKIKIEFTIINHNDINVNVTCDDRRINDGYFFGPGAAPRALAWAASYQMIGVEMHNNLMAPVSEGLIDVSEIVNKI